MLISHGTPPERTEGRLPHGESTFSFVSLFSEAGVESTAFAATKISLAA
jgi:hypothetical protein